MIEKWTSEHGRFAVIDFYYEHPMEVDKFKHIS